MKTIIRVITKAKGSTADKPIPTITISEVSLEAYGFKWQKLVALEYSYGVIDLKLHESEVDLKRIRSKSGFVRIGRNLSIKKGQDNPSIIVKGYWLNDMGFPVGTVVAVYMDSKRIQIKRVDMEGLKQEGFLPS